MQRKRVADYYSTVGAGEDTLEKRRSDWSRDKATTQRGGYDPLQAISLRLTEATSDRPCHSAGRLGCVPRDTKHFAPMLILPDPKFVSIPSGSYIHSYLLQWIKISGSTYSWVLLLSPTASASSLISRLQPNQSLCSKTHLRK